jgi:outer membrane cobalamin receptor
LIYLVILFSLPMQGQISLQNDTIRIKEVVISRKKFSSDPAGYKKSSFDSAIMKNYSHSTLNEILSENSLIFIKSYGMGGTATPAFRGTGASHTQIAWNGINLNHPMLGQTDLSLIPAGLVDNIQVYFGGASMTLNSGGIGGIINLETKPVWKKETLISINPGLGSFGRYTGLIKVRSGNVHFQSVTKAFFQSSVNDFKYLNTVISSEPFWQTRTNSQVRQQGFIQELYFRNANSVKSASIWYQSADRNLPSSMLTEQLNMKEKQFDESLRAILNYDGFKGRNKYFFTGAMLINRLNYTNTLTSTDSRNLSESFIFKTGMESQIDENSRLKMVLNEELCVIKSNNFDHNTTRNITTLTASFERNYIDRFGTTILIREILDRRNFLIPDFSAGFQFKIIDEKDYFIKANISRNSKIPTMNDMFWSPGGNPDLKNEYAFTYELTYEMKQKISSPLNIRYDLSLFRNSIRDMILWHPGEYSYWTADNIKSANSTGLESSVLFDYRANSFASSLSAGYSFTKSTTASSVDKNDISVGKQLIYIPVHLANFSLRFAYKNIYSAWIVNYTGKRFITVENSRYLPDFFINNITTGLKLNLNRNLLDINFNIENLFSVNYQTIAYYPLPGRSFSLKILFQILN